MGVLCKSIGESENALMGEVDAWGRGKREGRRMTEGDETRRDETCECECEGGWDDGGVYEGGWGHGGGM